MAPVPAASTNFGFHLVGKKFPPVTVGISFFAEYLFTFVTKWVMLVSHMVSIDAGQQGSHEWTFFRFSRGYTLIELLVVLAIIGLLTTLVLISLGSARQKARDAVRTGDVAQLRKALEIYYNVHASYPLTVADGEIGNSGDGSGCLGGNGWELAGCSIPVYLGLAPRDPSVSTTGPSGRPCKDFSLPCNYSYAQLSGEQYEIHFRLEAVTGELDAGLNCASEAGAGLACTHQ